MSVPTPVRLASLDDAAHLAEIALGAHDTAAALVDGAARLALPLRGPAGPEALLALDGVLLEADLGPGRLVLATRRPGGPPTPVEEELEVWRRLVAAHRGSPLVLCDWLVFTGDGPPLSLAELAGPPAPWATAA
jgi:hypothetical protein